MKKYMLTFFGGNMSLRYENLDTADKEARKKHMAAWGKWMSDLSKAKRRHAFVRMSGCVGAHPHILASLHA
jgi:hypothetical protein